MTTNKLADALESRAVELLAAAINEEAEYGEDCQGLHINRIKADVLQDVARAVRENSMAMDSAIESGARRFAESEAIGALASTIIEGYQAHHAPDHRNAKPPRGGSSIQRNGPRVPIITPRIMRGLPKPAIKITVTGDRGAGRSTIAGLIFQMLGNAGLTVEVVSKALTHLGLPKLNDPFDGRHIQIIDDESEEN